MSSIGERLKDERDRLGLNQTAFGAIGGVLKQAQLKYEKGERFPDASYLAAIAKVGADVQYIVTGAHCPGSLSADENELLEKFRTAPLAVKAAAIGALTAGGESQNKPAKQVFHGAVGQAIEGGITNSGSTTFNVGSSKAKE